MKRLAVVLLAAATLSCAPSGKETITVFAASSLTAAFDALGDAFEAAHPGITVRASFDSSTALARQITGGAPADVFAAADTESALLVEDRSAGPPRIFAKNRLAIATAKGNPRQITGPADLTRDGLIVVVCGDEVPCGRRTNEMLAKAKLTLHPASHEPSVRAALSKVVAGEADAAIVYETDVKAGGPAVTGVAISPSINVTSDYPVVTLRRASAGARAFVEYLLSPEGQRILRDHGFAAP